VRERGGSLRQKSRLSNDTDRGVEAARRGLLFTGYLARMVEKTFEPGMTVSLVARHSYQMPASQLDFMAVTS
jgi:hypothetical protein